MTQRRLDRCARVLVRARPLCALLVLSLLPVPFRWLATPLAIVLPGRFALDAITPRRKGLSLMSELPLAVIMSMAVYSVLSILEFTITGRLTRPSVLIGVAAIGILAACRTAGVPSRAFGRQQVRERLTGLALPCAAVAMAAALAIGAVTVIPGVAPSPYTQLSLAGRWALLDAPITVDGDAGLTLSVEIHNRSDSAQRLVVQATFRNGLSWSPTTVSLAAWSSTTVELAGPTPVGCGHLIIGAASDISALSPSSVQVWTVTSPDGSDREADDACNTSPAVASTSAEN